MDAMTSVADRERRERLIRQALERQPHQTGYFASYGRCTYGEAVVVLQRLRDEGVATVGQHRGMMTWRVA